MIAKIVKKLVKLNPMICDLCNREGYKPIVLFILSTPFHMRVDREEIEIALQILELLKRSTTMKQWEKDSREILIENACRMEELVSRSHAAKSNREEIEKERDAALGKMPDKTDKAGLM